MLKPHGRNRGGHRGINLNVFVLFRQGLFIFAMLSLSIALLTSKGNAAIESGFSGNCQYLIITGDQLKDSFQGLADLRTTNKGVTSGVISLSHVYANYGGVDNQEQIRNCIKDYVANRGTQYVVLGGDDTVVPVRYCLSVNPTHFAPCDYYFAGLDGNWNANGNNLYGEYADKPDLEADVILGRLPFRTEHHVLGYINKLKIFEMTCPQESRTNVEWGVGNALIRDYPWIYNREKVIYNHDMLDVMHFNYSEEYSHGSDQAFLDTAWDSKKALSTPTPMNFMQTIACSTGEFQSINDPCLSEAFLRNPVGGSIAFIAMSAINWNQEARPFMNNLRNQVFTNNISTFGKAFYVMKSEFSGNTSNFAQYIKYFLNFQGDPIAEVPGQSDIIAVGAIDPVAKEEGQKIASFKISRFPADQSLRVNYTLGGTALQSDYVEQLLGYVDFGPGEYEKLITITPVDNTVHEADKILTLTLIPLSTHKIWKSSDSCVIFDNDSNKEPVITSISAILGPNPVRSANLLVGATDPDGNNLTYNWSTIAGLGPVVYSQNNSSNANATTANFSAVGTYVLRCTVNDGRINSTSKYITVTIPQSLVGVTFPRGYAEYYTSGAQVGQLLPQYSTVFTSGNVVLSAAAIDQFGYVIPKVISWRDFTWSVTGGGSVDKAGRFTASSIPGSSVVTATYNGLTASKNVFVVQPTFKGIITVSQSATSIKRFETAQFTAIVRDTNTNQRVDMPVQWSINGGGSLDSTGHYTSNGLIGDYTVTASYANLSKSVKISVVWPNNLLRVFCPLDSEVYLNGVLLKKITFGYVPQIFTDLELPLGKNVIAVKGKSMEAQWSTIPSNKNQWGFKGEIVVNGKLLGGPDIWKATDSYSAGWNSTEFDDTAWPVARSLQRNSILASGFSSTIEDQTVAWCESSSNTNITDVAYFRTTFNVEKNSAPIAICDGIVTPEDVPAQITLSGQDLEGHDMIAYKITTPSSNGLLSGFPPQLTYTPNKGFIGVDRFIFTVIDSCNTVSAPKMVTLKVIPNLAPVLALRFNEGSGTTVADVSGQDHLTQLFGDPQWTTGKINKAISFNASNYAKVSSSSALNEIGANGSNYTVSFWLYLQQGPSNTNRSLVHKGKKDAERTFSMWMNQKNNLLLIRTSTTLSSSEGFNSRTELPVGSWIHVACVKQDKTMSLYLNGILNSTMTLRGAGITIGNQGDLYLGKDPWSFGTACTMDEFAVYNQALSADEIMVKAFGNRSKSDFGSNSGILNSSETQTNGGGCLLK